MTENEKIYTPIDEVSFKVEETIHHESVVNVPEQLQNIANVITQMKVYVTNTQQMKQKFYDAVEWYNKRIEILAEWVKKGNIPMELPEKMNIEADLDLSKFDCEKLPVISIKRTDVSDETEDTEWNA